MIKNKLIKILSDVYSKDSVKSIMSGRRRPSLENIALFEKKYNIPFDAWLDIKSYLQDNDTKHQDKKAMRRGAEC